jgi:hypothetical protein
MRPPIPLKMYEDPANAQVRGHRRLSEVVAASTPTDNPQSRRSQGGRWTLMLHNVPGLLDRVWQNLVCALIGETIDPDDKICGAVISIRPRVERIQVWVRNKDSWDKVEQIGHRLLQGLDIDGPNIVMSLEFAVSLRIFAIGENCSKHTGLRSSIPNSGQYRTDRLATSPFRSWKRRKTRPQISSTSRSPRYSSPPPRFLHRECSQQSAQLAHPERVSESICWTAGDRPTTDLTST